MASATCSIAMSAIPSPDFGMISGMVTGLPGAVVACLHLTEFVKDLKNTPTDVKTCSALTTLIAGDLKYLMSLRKKACNINYLSKNQDLAQRIDNIIKITQEGILDVGRLLEGCRRDIYKNGKVPVKARMQWVLGDSKAFAIREGNLQGVHRAVLNEIQFLRMRETTDEVVRGVVEHESFENLELLEMSYRRTHKKVMTVQVTEVMDEDLDDSKTAENKDVAPTIEIEVREPSIDTTSLKGHSRHETSSHSNVLASSLANRNFTTRSLGASWDNDSSVTLQDNSNIGEDDDPEAAYYRDLMLQDNERQRRMEARRQESSRNF